MSKRVHLPILVLAAVLAAACASQNSEPTRPIGDALVVRTVIPANGATNVDPNAPIVVAFNHPMMAGMELRIALHEASVTGPVIAGTSTWSADRTTLTFTPTAPLKSKTTYVLHFSPNLIDAQGDTINYGACAGPLGGSWVSPGMMGGGRGMMGSGWQPGGGTWGYGMTLAFTTA